MKQAKELSLKYKRIWQTKQFMVLVIIALVIIFEIISLILFSSSGFGLIIVFSTILLVTIIAEVSVLFVAEKGRREYNDLIDTGIVLKAKVNRIVIQSVQKGAVIEASYFDPLQGKVYYFKEKDWSVPNHFSAYYTVFNERKYIEDHPFINVLVRKDDYKRGYILMKEYFEEP